MNRRRVRRWASRIVLAAVFGAAAIGLHQAGWTRIASDVLWSTDVVWTVNHDSGKPGEGP